jgi:hypothetical protein
VLEGAMEIGEEELPRGPLIIERVE